MTIRHVTGASVELEGPADSLVSFVSVLESLAFLTAVRSDPKYSDCSRCFHLGNRKFVRFVGGTEENKFLKLMCALRLEIRQLVVCRRQGLLGRRRGGCFVASPASL